MTMATTMTTTTNGHPAAGRVELREFPRKGQLLGPGTIHEGETHIWHASPALHSDLEPAAILSEDEQERMAKFRFVNDQKDFLFYRSTLRILLASYLGAVPSELRFAYSAQGKPYLTAPLGDLEFNLSHTSGLGLFAICRGRRVGVDVERIRKDFAVMEIAGRFFSPAEYRALAQMPKILSHEGFFHCWTRKEAFVKARGEGLSYPLDSFDVSVVPEAEEVTLTTRPDSHEAGNWHLQSLNFFPEHAAALVVECPHKGELQF